MPAALPDQFLRSPQLDASHEAVNREASSYQPLHRYNLPKGELRAYQQQYADIYFLRLAKLKPVVADIASKAWQGFKVAGESPTQVDRVLDVQSGQLSWMVGTVYMDLPLKPNILNDISKEHWTPAPPPQRSYHNPQNQALSLTTLEDESGRVQLTGTMLQASTLVTGAIIAVLGTENQNGEFEVLDVKMPDFPPQPDRFSLTKQAGGQKQTKSAKNEPPKSQSTNKKIAFVSGLNITGLKGDRVALSLLSDYLLGYHDSSSSQISRLIIAGNSLGDSIVSDPESTAETPMPQAAPSENDKKTHTSSTRKYGHDASIYNPYPITTFDEFLSELLPSIPITLMPGESDPANFTLPQQPIHRVMLPNCRPYCSDTDGDAGWLDSVTNPWEGEVEGWRVWGCSGQNVDDILRYLDVGENEHKEEDGEEEEDDDATPVPRSTDVKVKDSHARLRTLDAMLRWRCGAPTAPDTLFCYPYQDDDPFLLQSCPHIFFAGNQPSFETSMISNNADEDSENNANDNPRVRIITLPKFAETGELVLLDAETLEVEVVNFDAVKSS